MPTPDEQMLNPMTDMLETEEQKQKRLEHERKLKEMLSSLRTSVELEEAKRASEGT